MYNAAMDQLSVHLFGRPRIAHNSEPIKINRRKAIALLAYLTVTQQSHSRDHLATMFWPDANQRRSRAALRSTIWAINNTAIAEWLVVDPEMVALRYAAHDSEKRLMVDVIHFRELLETAQRHDHSGIETCEVCHDWLIQTVSLYEDDFLAGFTLPDTPQFDEWQFFQANDLRQNLTRALEHVIGFHSTQGDFQSAIPAARRYLAIDPLHEPAHQILMRLYAETGQKSAALRQFEICRGTLESELNLEPSEETSALYKRIRGSSRGTDVGSGAGILADETKFATEDRQPNIKIPHNLPPDAPHLVGRQDELSGLTAFLDDPSTRLVTISGPGGIGKTRLALAAAGNQVSKNHFRDGIFFVPLSPLCELDAIIPSIAEAVGYSFQPDRRTAEQQIFDYLSRKSLLLLLDNFEHLLFENQAKGVGLIADLLQSTSLLKILVTSREGLNLYEEQRFPLQGLAVADAKVGEIGINYAAAELFLQTARRRQPYFDVVPEDMPYLADICQLVEGMPLALELAASWIDLLSLGEIASKLHQSLDILETNLINVPARHHNIQAVFDTSWNSLSEIEQKIYAQLTVFRDGFTSDAAEAVTDASLKMLAGLVNKSLVGFNQRKKRYKIHELLRQFAAKKLRDSTNETRDLHANYYCTFLQEREIDLKGTRQEAALAEIEADSRNARDAWNWAVMQYQISNLEKALVPLGLFYQMRSRFSGGEAMCQNGVERLTQILYDDDAEHIGPNMKGAHNSQAHLLVKLLTWRGAFYLASTQFDAARQSLQEAQRVLNELDNRGRDVSSTRAFLLLQLSHYSIGHDFGGETEELYKESLAIFRSIDDFWGSTLALDGLSQTNMNLGLHDKAIEQQKECLAIREKLGNQQGIARSYNILGLLVLHIGQIEMSEGYLRKSLSIFRRMNDRAQLSNPLAVLGINLLFGGKFDECISAYEECWAIHDELSMAQEPFTANVGMTRAKINLGRYQEARVQAQSNLAEYQSINHLWSIAFTLFNLGRIDLIEGAMGQAQQCFQESAYLLQKMNERSLLPDVLFCLAYTSRALNDRQRAIEYMTQSLKIVIETEPLNPMRFELPGMALLLADQGDFERAVEFYTAALQSPYIANSRWFEDIVGREIKEVAAKLPQHKVVNAQERGQSRNLWKTVNALLAALTEVSSNSPNFYIKL